MAPEYAMRGQFSVKSDVYSFGVLILEIVSGQKNNCFRNGERVEDLVSCVSIYEMIILLRSFWFMESRFNFFFLIRTMNAFLGMEKLEERDSVEPH